MLFRSAPGGGGKIPVMPQYIISQSPGKVILRNYEGVITTYTEPTNYINDCNCSISEKESKTEGIAALHKGDRLSLEPASLNRKKRNGKH